ncbi:hypothetical protein TWF751_009969 [Orbilia oligospora]|nr:hypothetical protein TWF751_009969 [Orbilia oligospora]
MGSYTCSPRGEVGPGAAVLGDAKNKNLRPYPCDSYRLNFKKRQNILRSTLLCILHPPIAWKSLPGVRNPPTTRAITKRGISSVAINRGDDSKGLERAFGQGGD